MSAITGVIGLIGTCFTGFMAFKMAQLKVHAEKAAVKVEAVKVHAEKAAEKVDAIHGIAQETLVHVNGQHTVQLKLYAEVTKTLAELQDTLANKEKAKNAERLYREQVKADELAAKTMVAVEVAKDESARDGK